MDEDPEDRSERLETRNTKDRAKRRIKRGLPVDAILFSGLSPKPKPMAPCHPERHIYARGVCKSCYNAKLKAEKRAAMESGE